MPDELVVDVAEDDDDDDDDDDGEDPLEPDEPDDSDALDGEFGDRSAVGAGSSPAGFIPNPSPSPALLRRNVGSSKPSGSLLPPRYTLPDSECRSGDRLSSFGDSVDRLNHLISWPANYRIGTGPFGGVNVCR